MPPEASKDDLILARLAEVIDLLRELAQRLDRIESSLSPQE
jgi:hypothetical protein